MKQKPRGRTAAEIARSLERSIHGGEYEEGAVLPAVRHLAASLGVSAATVAAAYRLLQARTLLVADGRRGTRIRRQVHVRRPASRTAALPAALIDLASGSPDPALLPRLSSGLSAVPDVPVLYGDAVELPELVRFATADFAADGIDVHDLVICSGALDGIERVLRERVRPGDRVAVEDPGYPALRDLLEGSGLVAEPVPIDQDGPLPEALERVLARKVAAIVLTVRAHNPTGAAIGAKRAAELRTIIKRDPDVLLIENDPFGPVAGVPYVTLTHDRQYWAVVRSTSKFLGPDLRLALLAGDPITTARVRGRQALGPRWTSHLLQRLALSLWSDPAAGRLLARTAETYGHRRAALVTALAAEGITATGTSGFNVWVPVAHEAAVVQRLASGGWAVAAGDRFRVRSAPGIRITTATLQADAAVRLAKDLYVALADPPLASA